MGSTWQGRGYDRQQQILELARTEGRVIVTDAARGFGVSSATLRRDLRSLELQQLIVRAYGVFYPTDIAGHETPVEHRRRNMTEERVAIARSAAEALHGRGSVFLDEGAIPEDIAVHVAGLPRLTVVTTSVTVAAHLAPTHHDVLMVGGRIRSRTMGTVDRWAQQMLADVNVELAVMGCNGVSLERGLTTPDPAVALTKTAAMAAARESMLVVEHNRFGVATFARFAWASQLDLIITGNQLPRTTADRFTARGPRVHRV